LWVLFAVHEVPSLFLFWRTLAPQPFSPYRFPTVFARRTGVAIVMIIWDQLWKRMHWKNTWLLFLVDLFTIIFISNTWIENYFSTAVWYCHILFSHLAGLLYNLRRDQCRDYQARLMKTQTQSKKSICQKSTLWRHTFPLSRVINLDKWILVIYGPVFVSRKCFDH